MFLRFCKYWLLNGIFNGFLHILYYNLSGYLYNWLLSEWFDRYANGDSSKGTLYPAIGEKDFFMGLIPLAPFEEQTRITNRINELLSLIT